LEQHAEIQDKKINPVQNSVFKNGSLQASGVEDKKENINKNEKIVLTEDRSVQDRIIQELKKHEEEINTELEELQSRTKKMNGIIENFNKQ